MFGMREFVVIFSKHAVGFGFRFFGCSQNNLSRTLGFGDFQI